MKSTASLAMKYLKYMKRQTIFSLLSITAAVVVITFIFTAVSTIFVCCKNIEYAKNPWHASVYAEGFTDEALNAVKNSEDIENIEKIGENNYVLRYKTDVYDCYKATDNALKNAGCTVDDYGKIFSKTGTSVTYYLNDSLLFFEQVGHIAKANMVTLLAMIYIVILVIIFFGRFVIDTAFEISSKERSRQFAVLRSVGASKRHIIGIILHESVYLSVIAIPLGMLLGVGASWVVYEMVKSAGFFEAFAQFTVDTSTIAEFSVSPLFLIIAALTCFVWVLLSAYATAARVNKSSITATIRVDAEAVKLPKKAAKNQKPKTAKHITLKLALKNVTRNKKRFAVSVVSISLSMILFTSFAYFTQTGKASAEAFINLSAYDFSADINIGMIAEEDTTIPPKLEADLAGSGMFTDIQPVLYLFGDIAEPPVSDDASALINGSLSCRVMFVNENTYNMITGSNPPVPYQTLADENKTVDVNFCHIGREKVRILDLDDMSSVSINCDYYEKSNTPEYTEDENGNKEQYYPTVWLNEALSFDIAGVCDTALAEYKSSPYTFTLIAAEPNTERYNKYLSCHGEYIHFNLIDGADNDSAEAVLGKIGESYDRFSFENYYLQRKSANDTLFSVKLIGYSLIILISLIAIINAVNTIVTGILNRRREFAVLKSLGMTKSGAVRLVTVECALYAAISGIIALAVSGLLLLLTSQSMNMMLVDGTTLASVVSYGELVPYALITIPAAFVICLIAAVIPLRIIGKASIADEIRQF